MRIGIPLALAFTLILTACSSHSGESIGDPTSPPGDTREVTPPPSMDVSDSGDAEDPPDGVNVDASDVTPPEGGHTSGDESGDVDPEPDSGDVTVPLPLHACVFPPQPPADPVKLVNAFPNLIFSKPVFLTHRGDGSNRLYVVEQEGRIETFENTPLAAGSDLFLDVSDLLIHPTGYTAECGLLGLAFHPDPENPAPVFINYTTNEGGAFRTVISRWSLQAGNPNAVDPASETVILEIPQPYNNHNGGMIGFGPDGLLYIGMGDGGSAGDPLGHGQNKETLLAAILRIDIDSASPYAIPPDNPLMNSAGRDEIYAWGLRNPWRFDFDPLTHELWTGDVGQKQQEEVDIIIKGGNYGWNVTEGDACHLAQTCNTTGFIAPVLTYTHSVGKSITGGAVYRGSEVPSLYGKYIYADYVTKLVFAWEKDGEEPPTEPLLISPAGISSFGVDEQGELHALGLSDGRIRKFVEAFPVPTNPLPPTLSEAHCFSSLETLSPLGGVHPYDVSAPFWADGALKQRWVALPHGTAFSWTEDGELVAPVDTVFLKHFEMQTSTENSPRRLETRVLIVEGPGAVRGHTYRWNEEGTEAHLLQGGATEALAGDSVPEGFTWQYPSAGQCLTCHTDVSGGVLGFNARQLQGTSSAGTTSLQSLLDAGAILPLSSPLPEALPDPADASVDLADRARAYLDSNCSHCHQPDGPTPTALDLRYTTLLEDMSACGLEPEKGSLGIDTPALLMPGSPDQSIVLQRMLAPAESGHRMPPLGSLLADPLGTSVIQAWIVALEQCP